MPSILRIIRTALQALVSLVASVPLAWFHVLPTGWLAVLSAGLVVTVSLLHNATSFLDFIDKFVPAKYRADVTDAEDVVARLEILAQTLGGAVGSKASAASPPPGSPTLHAGYSTKPVPDVAGRDVARKV